MSFSTSLLGPYDDLSTTEKIIISAAVPHEIKDFMFVDFLPRRGAVDKVLARGFYLIYGYIQANESLMTLSESDRETVVNKLFNKITVFLQDLDVKEIMPDSPEVTLQSML